MYLKYHSTQHNHFSRSFIHTITLPIQVLFSHFSTINANISHLLLHWNVFCHSELNTNSSMIGWLLTKKKLACQGSTFLENVDIYKHHILHHVSIFKGGWQKLNCSLLQCHATQCAPGSPTTNKLCPQMAFLVLSRTLYHDKLNQSHLLPPQQERIPSSVSVYI